MGELLQTEQSLADPTLIWMTSLSSLTDLNVVVKFTNEDVGSEEPVIARSNLGREPIKTEIGWLAAWSFLASGRDRPPS
jgi:hypothetical protein